MKYKLLIMMIVILSSCMQKENPDNRHLINDLYGSVDKRDWEKMTKFFHPEFTDHRYAKSDSNNGAAIVKIMQGFTANYPKTRFKVLQTMQDADMIAGRIEFTIYRDSDSTTYCNYDFYKVKDGQLTDMWFSTTKVEESGSKVHK